MNRFKVVVTDYVFPSLDIERSVLAPLGADVVSMQAKSDDQLLDVVADADGMLVCYAPVTKRVIDRAERCQVIARYGIGVDNVDIKAAEEKGIVVTNVPDYCVDEVSDHALAMLLACARRIPLLDRRVRAGRWMAKDAVPVYRLRGQILGLIGFGKIPRALASKASALGLQCIAFDPYIDEVPFTTLGVKKVDFQALLVQADFVSVHAPLTSETRGVIGETALRAMKPSAYLINTARGPLVDDSALARALKEGWIAGAALDVLQTEPPTQSHPLLGLDNIILTPHVGFYSEASLQELQRKAAEEVATVLRGQSPRYPVNSPRPTLKTEGGHR